MTEYLDENTIMRLRIARGDRRSTETTTTNTVRERRPQEIDMVTLGLRQCLQGIISMLILRSAGVGIGKQYVRHATYSII